MPFPLGGSAINLLVRGRAPRARQLEWATVGPFMGLWRPNHCIFFFPWQTSSLFPIEQLGPASGYPESASAMEVGGQGGRLRACKGMQIALNAQPSPVIPDQAP